MHLSHYLKVFPYPEEQGYVLLFSTRNSAMALVDEEDYQSLQQGEIPPDLEETLAELGMLVDDPEREKQEVCDMLDEINRLDTGLNVSVILGLACNFSCVYCYEGSLKDGQSMSDRTAEQLVVFLKERYLVRSKERLILDFYGGEPLLYPEKIKNICVPLKRFVEERDGRFQFSLVTNGSLLTPEVVAELKNVGLYGAKVTVDGPPDEHNRLRPFRSGKPSFDLIMKNIADCCSLVKIGFGGNYTRENFRRVPELLDLAEKKYNLTPRKLGNVQFHPVMQTADRFANPEFTGGCLSTDESWVAEASIMVRQEVLRRGYRTPKLTVSPCMVDLDDAMVINHDGRLYKCVAMIGYDNLAAGDIRNGYTDYAKTYHLNHWQQQAECRECEYLPLCFGGCRYAELQRSETMEKVDCMRGFWERVLEKTVRQDASLLQDI